MNAQEMAVLSRELEDAREKLRRADERLKQLEESCSLTERLAAPMDAAFPLNHHLRTNRHILWLCLCSEISALNSDRAKIRRVIDDLADQLTTEGIRV